ncbi:MAG: hypothetical protein OXI60_09575 [Acidiferrobacterales bacterium]|nr:hypothetical protein [Acidiferrobacterales bacterium]
MADPIILREYDRLAMSSEFSQDDIADLRNQDSRVFSFSNGNLVAQNYVGIFTTKSRRVIEILPKIDFSSDSDKADKKTREIFLSMLRHWRRKGFQELSSSQIRTLRNFPLLEAFIFLFLSNVRDLIRSGLARRYIEVEENLPYLRGRLDFTGQIRENLIDQSNFYVRHDEFSENRPANRLIHKTLKLLRSQVTDSDNRQLLQQVTNPFSDIPASTNIHADWNSHHVDRTMQHYKGVMNWIILFLFDERLATFAGSHENVSLLFPMEEVFEDFVIHSFRRYQNKYDVHSQGPRKPLASKDGDEGFYMKPDISLKQGNSVRFILDAKWKRVGQTNDLKYGISQSDMYQLFAYGKNYDCKTVALIYPKSDQYEQSRRFEFMVGDMSLLCFLFDVTDPEGSVNSFINSL